MPKRSANFAGTHRVTGGMSHREDLSDMRKFFVVTRTNAYVRDADGGRVTIEAWTEKSARLQIKQRFGEGYNAEEIF